VTLAPNVYFSPKQMQSIIGCCDLTITMRYHFCLFSALQGVPFVAIQRSDKLSDLCWDIAWPAAVVPPAFSAEELVDHAQRLTCRDRGNSIEHLSCAVRIMKERALRNSETLSALQCASVRP
jgi:polysaccharide pyruvyl transferase WcaK-like protein